MLAGGLFLHERGVTVHVELSSALDRFGVRELRLGLRQLSFSLAQRRLKRPWIDLKEHLALLNEGAFLVGLGEQIAGHLRFDVRIDHSVQGADPFAVDRNILLLDPGDLNVGGVSRPRCRCGLRAGSRTQQSDSNQGNRYPYRELAFQDNVRLHFVSSPDAWRFDVELCSNGADDGGLTFVTNSCSTGVLLGSC